MLGVLGAISTRISVFTAALRKLLSCSSSSGALLQRLERCVTPGSSRTSTALQNTAETMGKKRRAFDDDADESEEDEISRHAEAAWLARRRALA